MVFIQLIFNSLVAGGALALMAVGFNLVFSTTKVFHLAHGAIYTLCAYAFFLFAGQFSFLPVLFSWLISLLMAFGLTAVAAVAIERFVYQPLVEKHASQSITLISSLGVYILVVNAIALTFGNETKLENFPIGGSLVYGRLVILPVQLAELLVFLLVIAGVWWFSRGRWYLKVRALLSNEQAAVVTGVNAGRVRLIMMITAALLAGIPAIFRLCDTGIDPQAGMELTLSAVVAVIIGGNGSIAGTIASAFLIAIFQAFVEYFLSAQWKEGVTFLLLMAMILTRTEGIVSLNLRVEEK